jgi:hypothetical protein
VHFYYLPLVILPFIAYCISLKREYGVFAMSGFILAFLTMPLGWLLYSKGYASQPGWVGNIWDITLLGIAASSPFIYLGRLWRQCRLKKQLWKEAGL